MELPDNEIMQAVRSGMVDVGFMYYQDYREKAFLSEIENKEMFFCELIREPFCVLVSAKNPMYHREHVTIEEMNQYSFICEVDKTNNLMHRRFFPSWFNENRLAPVKFGNNRGAMCYLADHPDCFFMGQRSLNHTNPLVVLNQFKYIPLSDTPYLAVTGYIIRKDTVITPAKRGFLSYISNYFAAQT